jgi:hypothetical protein
MNKLYIIFSLLIFSNCKEGAPQYLGNTTPLFDLKGFLDNEIATHLKDVKTVKKTVTVNGKTEIKEVEIKDWKEELKPFFNSDINRPAWRDKYTFEKKMGDTVGYFHSFQRLADNLKTKNLSVHFNDAQQTISVALENDESSVIGSSKQALKFTSQKQYSIESTQTSFLGNKDTITISVEY